MWPKSLCSTPTILPSVCQPTSMSSWTVPYNKLTKEGKETSGSGLLVILYDITSTTQERTAIAPWPFSRIPPKDNNENNRLIGHHFMQYTQLFILLRRRNGQNYESIPFNGLCLVVRWLIRTLEGTQLES